MDAIIGTGKLSRRQYNVILERDIRIPVSDGVEIDTDLFRPDSKEKFPALLSISPYCKELQSDQIWPRAMGTTFIRGANDASIEAGPIDFFVRRGYVRIIASVRGTGKSGGIYRYLCHREIQDIYDIVEWAALQPWCNGNVGIIGTSYYAWSQQQAAALQPPHLKAICPFFAATDAYRDVWYHGGIIKTAFLNILFSAGGLDLHSEACVAREEMGDDEFQKAIARALQDRDLCAEPGFVNSLSNPNMPVNAAKIDVLLHPTDGPYWRERSVVNYDKIKVPVYLGCCWGMYELHLPGTFRSWMNLDVPKKMVIGPPIYLDRPVHQYHWEMLRWYDHWLKGIETGIVDEPPVKIFVMGTDNWKMADDWPLPDTKWIPFFLHAGGILCDMEPWPKSPSASYRDAPGERGSLTYYSPKLVENTEVIGPIALTLYASCRSTDINFFVSIWDVDQDGNETLLTRGWLKGSHREIDQEKSKPWQPVLTHTNPEPLIPGQVYKFDIEIMPTANLFKAGHQIALRIKGAVDEPHKTTLNANHAPHLSRQTPSIVTIYQDADYPSCLLLPITSGNIVGTFLSGGDISMRVPKVE